MSIGRASSRFLTRYERELREPLVWRQGPWVPDSLSQDDAKKWPNLESLPLVSLFIPFQDNEDAHGDLTSLAPHERLPDAWASLAVERRS